ncbi:hypothetical protein OIU85_001601 [Salix viminalis]|uniref:GH16 domain-containing protein n=1 Tax=Salix viminalis TaxID=40686 RepID=A0A9Q0ZYC6_SALVM|nr:hypothetical protein OIU85_001601 [Salix viminalis]
MTPAKSFIFPRATAASDQPNRLEIDFEFLGNVSGQPYILQTNVYADTNADRSWWIGFLLEFTETIYADKGVAYPRRQPSSIKVSLWKGDSWATRGGKDTIDWSKGHFIASFRNYKMDACQWNESQGFGGNKER